MAAHNEKTTLVIGNIHCPSCVSTITSILSAYPMPSERRFNSARRSIDKVVDTLRTGGSRTRSSSPDTFVSSTATDEYELFSPAFTQVNVSIINGTVSFSHPRGISLKNVIAELEDAGFEVIQTGQTDLERNNNAKHLHRPAASTSTWSRFADLFSKPKDRDQAHKDNCEACREEEAIRNKRDEGDISRAGRRRSRDEIVNDPPQSRKVVEAIFSVEGMTCSSCTSALESALHPEKMPGILSIQVLLVDDSATIIFDTSLITKGEIIDHIEDLGYEAKCVSEKVIEWKGEKRSTTSTSASAKKSAEVAYKVQLSIGGMTCASCVGAISNMLDSLKGVQGHHVDLMSGSGTVTILDKAMATTVQSEIEDLGYDCKIMSVTETGAEAADTSPSRKEVSSPLDSRTVNVRIEGFFCEHCPAKANRVLEDLSTRFEITYTPSTLHNPVSTLTYTAEPPNVTLRTIRRAITELGFTISLVKAESLQDRARLAQKRERQRILLRLIICILFCIPTFVIGVVIASLLPMHNAVKMYFHESIWGGASRITVALFVLATPIQFGVGQFFYSRAYKSLRGVWRVRRGRVNRRKVWLDRLLRWGSMDTLVALGTTIAWASSLAYMVLDIVGVGDGEMAYFDTSVFLITFILAGRYLESISKARTGDAISELGKLRPKHGLLYQEGQAVEEVESEFIEVGDQLLVPVGQSPPVDCTLAPTSSSTSFDEASLTGESRPVAKHAGDTIYAGTINAGPSAAIVIVQKRDGETVIDSIAAGVRDAMSKKASIERLADAVTAVFVPFIVGVACLTFIVWILRAYSGHLPDDWLDNQKSGGWILFSLQFTVACLVVACPCGIGLAAPTAQLVGVGLAARQGIMPNGGGEAFQAFTHIDAIAFDKTGTITKGKFQVSDDRQLGVLPTKLLWNMVANTEQASSHPIALAIHAYAREKLDSIDDGVDHDDTQSRVWDLQELPGRGMQAKAQTSISGQEKTYDVYIGNEKMLNEAGGHLTSEMAETLHAWQGQGKSVVLIGVKARDESNASLVQLAAMLGVADPLRPEASFVLDHFRNRGVEVYIVSGDGQATVKAVARTLNLPDNQVVGGALPDDKRRFVQDLQEQTKRVRGWNGRLKQKRKLVAFVGDGINDAIALAQADVSIAQGGGSQAATSTADFALLSASLLSLITLQAISRATYRRIISNFGWACIYNVVLIPLAAGAFYDLGRTKLPAVWASLAMALSSVSVVLNSLLLRYTFRLPKEVKRFRDQC